MIRPESYVCVIQFEASYELDLFRSLFRAEFYLLSVHFYFIKLKSDIFYQETEKIRSNGFVIRFMKYLNCGFVFI